MCVPKFDGGRRGGGVRQRQPVLRCEFSDGERVVNGLDIDATRGRFVGGKGYREDDPERGPGARDAAKGDAAAMVFDDLVGEGEAEGLCRRPWSVKNGIEDFVGLGRGYSRRPYPRSRP